LFSKDLPTLYEIPEWYQNHFTVLTFPPPSITFYPFELDSIKVQKDFLLHQYDADTYQMIRFNTVISTKAYIFLWRNVDTGHKLNTIKLTVRSTSAKTKPGNVHIASLSSLEFINLLEQQPAT
jgi:hypothetical protein